MTPLGTREVFDGLSIPAQRQVLHGVIEKVTLSTAKGSAEERLVIEFKDGTVVSKAERDARQVEIARQIAEAIALA